MTWRFLLRRLLLLAFTLWVASVLVFAISSAVPANVGRTILGPFASAESVATLNHQLGMDRPVLARYASWAVGVLTGDWGRSLRFETPVLPLVLERTGRSLVLAGICLFVLAPVAVALGVVAALRAGSGIDRALMVFGMVFGAIPEFVTGVFLILIFGVWLGALPIQGLPPPGAGPIETLRHLVLPCLCLVLLLFTYVFRMTRGGTIEALGSDATRTAVLKGLPGRVVLWRHVLPNALAPTITVVGAQLGWMMGGLVVVETLFRYPGLGSLITFGATNRDLPLLVGCTLMVALVYGVGNLLADMLQVSIDPRLRRAR